MAGPIRISVLADAGQARRELGAVASETSSLGSKIGQFGKTAALAAGAAGLAAGGLAVKFTADAAKLDTKMREVVTLFGETGKAADRSLGQVQGQVRDLSNEFGIAQEELTGGLYSAISAGVPKDNAFEFMQVASKAAIGGVTDVATTVDGLSSTINAFGLEASDAQAVADSMFTAVKGGKTTFAELSDSLFNVAPAAAAAGVSFQEVNAGIAALTAGGTPTSVATTQIRAALTGLQKPSEDLDRIFRDLGFQNAQLAVESKGLGFALGAVKDASGGNNGELQKLLGSTEAVAAANVIAGTGAKKFADEMANQADSAGAATKAFDVVNAGLERNFAVLKTRLTNIGLQIGQAILPVALRVATALNNMLGPALARAQAVMATLAPIFTQIGAAAAGLLASLQPVGAWFAENPEIIKGAAIALGVAAAAAVALGAALGVVALATSPITLTVVAIAAVGAGFAYAYKNSETFRNGIQAIVAAFQNFISTVVPIVQQIVAAVAGKFRELQPQIKSVWSSVQNIIKSAMVIIKATIQTVTGVIKGIWQTFGQTILRFITTTMTNVANLIKSVFKIIEGLFKVVSSALRGDWTGMWNGIKQITSGAVGVLKAVISQAWNLIRTLTSAAWTALKAIVAKAWDGVKSAVSTGISSVLTMVRGLPGKITGALGDLGSLLFNAGASLIKGLIGGIDSMIGTVKDKLGGLTDLIPDIKGPPAKDKVLLRPAGRLIMQGLVDGFADGEDEVKRSLQRVTAIIAGSDLTQGGRLQVRASQTAQARARLAGQALVDSQVVARAVTTRQAPAGQAVTSSEAGSAQELARLIFLGQRQVELLQRLIRVEEDSPLAFGRQINTAVANGNRGRRIK